ARHAARGVAHDVPGDPDLSGLGVLVVDAGVADVRRRHDDDLPVVGRVGQGLLVPGHAGGEHDLAEGGARGTERAAAVGRAVLEDEDRGLWGRRGGHRASCWYGWCWGCCSGCCWTGCCWACRFCGCSASRCRTASTGAPRSTARRVRRPVSTRAGGTPSAAGTAQVTTTRP